MLNIAQSPPSPLTRRPQAALNTSASHTVKQSTAQCSPTVQFGFAIPKTAPNTKTFAVIAAVSAFWALASIAIMPGRGSSTTPTQSAAAPTVQQPAEDPQVIQLKKQLEIEKLTTQLHEAQEANKPH